MMCKVFIILTITLLSAAQGFAQQSGQLYLSPSYPYSTNNRGVELLDSSLQKELVDFSDRRTRAQNAQFAHMEEDNGLVQQDSYVLRRILDRSLMRFTKSNYFKKSTFGKQAEHVKKNIDTDMQFTDHSSKHKVDFKLAGFQGQAFIQYTGFTRAQLRYDVRNGGSLALIYKKNVTEYSNFSLENVFTGDRRGQFLNINMIW